MMDGWLPLVGWILVVYTFAGLGGGAARPGAWYRSIAKPVWNPPDWVFGPVWGVLFTLMGIAAWLVWSERATTPVAVPLGVFMLQLTLNALWSWIFFRWHRIGWALVELMALWVAVLATILAFWSIRPLAGWLLVPYLLWVTFAGFLNFGIWRRNSR